MDIRPLGGLQSIGGPKNQVFKRKHSEDLHAMDHSKKVSYGKIAL